MFPYVVWEALGKHPPARWQQSFSNASDPLVLPLAFLENDIHVLLAVLTEASVVAVAVTSLNDFEDPAQAHMLV